jgi:CheY-like chemotaxis protein
VRVSHGLREIWSARARNCRILDEGYAQIEETVDHIGFVSDEAAAERALREISVLVIDDDPEARDMLAAVLENAGYSVATAENGFEALELLHHVRPQLILLDVVMPMCDGAEFRQEQRRNKDWIKIPTIVMTGLAEEPVLDVAVEHALRKPIRGRELLALVDRYCNAH